MQDIPTLQTSLAPIPRTAMSARERSLRSRLTRLTSGLGLMDGSLVERHRRCGKPTCRCARDSQSLHRSVYLFRHEAGRTHQLYIPARWEGRVRQWIDDGYLQRQAAFNSAG